VNPVCTAFCPEEIHEVKEKMPKISLLNMSLEKWADKADKTLS
jgi:hypothetical protein